MTATNGAGQAGRRAVALVRHGHFDRPDEMASAHLPLPLSPLGREQAEQAADRLFEQARACQLEIDGQIESSQLLRAHETASILATALSRRLGRPFVVQDWPDLLERSLGSCANLTFPQIKQLLAEDPRLGPLPDGWRRHAHFRLPVPGAESQMESGERTANRIRERVEAMAEIEPSSDRLKIIVAHGGCLRHACVHLGALEVERAFDLDLRHADSVVIERLSNDDWTRIAGEWSERSEAIPAPTSHSIGESRT